MTRIIIFFILLNVICLQNESPSQSKKTTISGFVTDAASGDNLIAVNVILYKDTITNLSKPIKGTSTNKYGFYALPDLENGVYFVVCTYVGYKSNIEKVVINNTSSSIRINIALSEEKVVIDEVVVTGEKNKKSEISTITVSPDIIKQLPSFSGEANVFKTLEFIPGIKVASELSNGIYVRGGSPDQTLTLLDGVIIYNPSHLGNFASTFNSNSLQDVRLLKGAFPAEYGGRLSSVLDIKLRSGTKQVEKGMIGLGLLNSNFSLEGPFGSKATFMLSGRKMYYDLIQKSINKNNSLPRYNFYDLNGKINYNFNSNSKVFISALFGKDNLYSPPTSKDIDYNISWKNSTVSLNWLNIDNQSLFSNTWLSYIDYEFTSKLDDKNTLVGEGDYFSSSKLQDILIKRATEYIVNTNHTIKAGAEVNIHKYNLIYSDYYEEEIEQDERVGTNSMAMETSLYFQDECEILPLLTTNAGLRFYFFNKIKFFRVEPRFSATYALTENLFLKSAFAVAHQFLHLIVRNDIALPTDLWYPSTSTLDPSKSIQYVFSIESYFDKQAYLFSLEGYYKEMKNLYEFSNSRKSDLQKPIEEQFVKGKGESYGVELFFNKRSGNVTGWIGYTLSWTKRLFPDLNAGKVFNPRYDRRHDVSVVLTYNYNKKFNAGLIWTYATGQGYTVPSGQYSFQEIGDNSDPELRFNTLGLNTYRMPAYHKLDLNFSYFFTWSKTDIELYLNLFNLYNRKNAFAQYISADEKAGEKIPKLKQLTLFPFIPTIGVNIKF